MARQKRLAENEVYELPAVDLERRKEGKIHQINSTRPWSNIIQKFSDSHSVWTRLLQDVFWLIRFVEWLRSKQRIYNIGILSLEELNHVSNWILNSAAQRKYL